MERTPSTPIASAGRQLTVERLHKVAIRLLRTLRAEDAVSGLSPARASALSVLVFVGPRSLGALAQAEGVKPPSMSRLVAEMEREGLVHRATSPEDGRSVVLTATARARRLLHAARARRLARLERLLAGRSSGEWTAIERAVDSLERALPTA